MKEMQLIDFLFFTRFLLHAISISLSVVQAALSGSKCPLETVSLATLSVV